MTKAQTRKLNQLLATAVRLRDKRCLRCSKTTTLQTSHIYPKGRYTKMKFELDNVKVLCYKCHIHWWHKNPIEAAAWLKTAIPAARLNRLKKLSQDTNLPPLDYDTIKKELEKGIQKYG